MNCNTIVPIVPANPQRIPYNYQVPYNQRFNGEYMPSYGSAPGNYNNQSMFMQFAEEMSRSSFSKVGNLVQTVKNISMMLDNMYFSMTSLFAAVRSLSEHYGNVKNTFGHIWNAINIFKYFMRLYTKLKKLLGLKVVEEDYNTIWNEVSAAVRGTKTSSAGIPWGTLAFLTVIVSAPFYIGKYIFPKYEDRVNQEKWKSPGYRAKGKINFVASRPNEMSVQPNDGLLVAPKYIQAEMNLLNSGWVFAVGNGSAGIVPMNHLLFLKKQQKSADENENTDDQGTNALENTDLTTNENEVNN